MDWLQHGSTNCQGHYFLCNFHVQDLSCYYFHISSMHILLVLSVCWCWTEKLDVSGGTAGDTNCFSTDDLTHVPATSSLTQNTTERQPQTHIHSSFSPKKVFLLCGDEVDFSQKYPKHWMTQCRFLYCCDLLATLIYNRDTVSQLRRRWYWECALFCLAFLLIVLGNFKYCFISARVQCYFTVIKT